MLKILSIKIDVLFFVLQDKDDLCDRNYFSMTFNVRLNACALLMSVRQTEMLRALFHVCLCVLSLDFLVSRAKPVDSYERYIAWCEIGNKTCRIAVRSFAFEQLSFFSNRQKKHSVDSLIVRFSFISTKQPL